MRMERDETAGGGAEAAGRTPQSRWHFPGVGRYLRPAAQSQATAREALRRVLAGSRDGEAVCCATRNCREQA